MRLVGTVACILAALDCFAKDGQLGLPYWAWALAGFGWLLNATLFATGVWRAA